MSNQRPFSSIGFSMALALAATATLSVAGCEKQPTTAPGDEPAQTDASDDLDDVDTATDDNADAEPEVAEPLSKSNFDETINDHFSEVSDCYVAALEGNPELQGTLNAEFTIGDAGQVVGIVAVDDSTLNDDGLVECITAAAANWTFATPAAGELVLRYSYKLAPG